MYYTAVLFARGKPALTREVQTCGLKYIFNLLITEGGISKEEVHTILLLKNGQYSPEIVDHWSSKGGHFKGL